MAYDGSGNFQYPSPDYPFIPDTVILAEAMNNILAEAATALTQSITRDGSGGVPTVSIKWGSQKLIELGSGTADADAVNYGQVFKNPVFQSPRAAASPAADDNSLKLATTEFVRAQAFSTALPGQSLPKAGYALITNGTTADWQSIDSRGVRYVVKAPSGVGPITVDFQEAEAHALTITGAATISFTGFPANRVAVRLLTLTNAGLFPPVFAGVVWIGANGQETANFAETGVAWQANGRDRVIVCAEPGLTPWAKVIR